MNELTQGKNIGALLVPHVCAIQPIDTIAATLLSAAYDRVTSGLPLSCVASVMNGVASGSPSAVSVIGTIEHSSDDSSYTTFATLDTIAADSTNEQLDVDLSLAKRYLKLQIVVSFTAGSTPKTDVCGQLIMGGFETLPQT